MALDFTDFPQRAYVIKLNNGTTESVAATATVRLYSNNTLAVFDAAGALVKAWAGATVWLAVT